MPFFRSFQSWTRSRSSAKRSRAAERLGEQLASLESELTRSASTLAELRDGYADVERRALIAIAAGDHRAARDAFTEQMALGQEVALLEADCEVLQELIDECRTALRQDAMSTVARESS